MSPKHTFHIAIPADGAPVRFPETEARHAARVLRLRTGDEVLLVDGQGTRAVAELTEVGKRAVSARILSREETARSVGVRVTIGAGLIKHTGRFETMLEKVAELGAARVVPLETARTERSRLRMDRAESILSAAMKQCGSAYCTEIAEPLSLSDFLDAAPESALRLLCHEQVSAGDSVLSRLRAAAPVEQIFLAVGPEGGFTDQEVDRARSAGFTPASLGASTLRAETAAIAAMAVIAQFPWHP